MSADGDANPVSDVDECDDEDIGEIKPAVCGKAITLTRFESELDEDEEDENDPFDILLDRLVF